MFTVKEKVKVNIALSVTSLQTIEVFPAVTYALWCNRFFGEQKMYFIIFLWKAKVLKSFLEEVTKPV